MPAAAAYAARLGAQQERAAAAQRQDLRYGLGKIAALGALLGLAWLAAISHVLSLGWALLPLVLLVALFLGHDRVLRAKNRAQRLVAYYQRLQARIEDRWRGGGEAGERFRDPQHPYADDLDLFGPGSLFELLSTSRTRLGQGRLAAWMLAPAALPEIARRQGWIARLREQLEVREELAGLGDHLDHVLEAERLAAWAGEPARLTAMAARVGLAAAAAVAIALGVYGIATLGFGPFFVWVLAQGIGIFALQQRLEPALARRGADGEGLRLLAGVLGHMPPELAPAGSAAVAPLRRLARLADWMDAQDSLLGRLLDFVILYRAQLAYAADQWRARHGAQVAAWLQAAGEFEALLALASLAYERPDDVFPEVGEGDAAFEAEGLGHPLLPEATCVRNSLRLGSHDPEIPRILLVSGSNMSGKSTWLRTVGLNAVLALMGAPVRAQRLRLARVALGTRLRTVDSLQLGRSGFYAEILRLRQVFELTRGPLPVLFLFDELLEGTNSHDRVIGASGLLRALLARPTIGLVTTHDLALTAIAGRDPRIRNMHFEDQIEGDDVRFDHRLRPGVVTRSNALALMRIVGLELDGEGAPA